MEDNPECKLANMIFSQATDAPTRFPTPYPTASVIYVVCLDGSDHTLEVQLRLLAKVPASAYSCAL